MKEFSHCPKCGNILRNDFVKTSLKNEVLHKTCEKYVSHWFKCIVDPYTDTVLRLSVKINDSPPTEAVWNSDHTLLILKVELLDDLLAGRDTRLHLPYFEPDFSDYDKLINKIRTLIVFS